MVHARVVKVGDTIHTGVVQGDHPLTASSETGELKPLPGHQIQAQIVDGLLQVRITSSPPSDVETYARSTVPPASMHCLTASADERPHSIVALESLAV